MIPPQTFVLCTFYEEPNGFFGVKNRRGEPLYYGDNPIQAMIYVQNIYEAAIRKKLLPLITAEGYNRIGEKKNECRGVQKTVCPIGADGADTSDDVVQMG